MGHPIILKGAVWFALRCMYTRLGERCRQRSRCDLKNQTTTLCNTVEVHVYVYVLWEAAVEYTWTTSASARCGLVLRKNGRLNLAIAFGIGSLILESIGA